MTPLPKSAAALVALAETNGWTAETTYAETDGASSWAVRLRRERSIVAMWISGRFWTGLVSSPAQRLNLGETRALVGRPRREHGAVSA